MNELTVSELNRQIKAILESHFSILFVRGEVSNLVVHTSGHIYFSLKDEESSVRCVLFRSSAQKLKFKLENGALVIAQAALSVYPPRGEYQLTISSLTPDGIGSLSLALEQLKRKLQEKGYFEHSAKKTLPKFPKKVALITSATGAALQDMLKVAKKRWLLCEFVLFNTLVQGEGSAEQIAKNIELADSMGFDAIVVARGGGSIEDLWSFNEECVADAVYFAKTPIVTGIGHEIDVTIADMVADFRAPTPSAAMEKLLPDSSEIMLFLDSLREQFDAAQGLALLKKEAALKHIRELLISASPAVRLAFTQKEIENTRGALKARADAVIAQKSYELMALKSAYQSSNPTEKISKNSALLAREGAPIELKDIEIGDIFWLYSKDTAACARLESKREL